MFFIAKLLTVNVLLGHRTSLDQGEAKTRGYAYLKANDFRNLTS